MDTFQLTRRLLGMCARHWFLRRFQAPLYRHAERMGYKPLVRENALRLLAKAHVARLTGDEAAPEVATEALDRFAGLAAQGDPEAAWHVAEAHRTGFGRPRNHWKALDHYQVAADLGHPHAPERLRQLREGEAVADGSHEAFGRQALLEATYARGEGEHRARALGAWVREREGIGLRNVYLVAAAAGLLLGYLALDIYFSGMGGWRPDPTRVVWGLFGKIHPPRDDGAGRVLPGWLRPDARSVTFTQDDFKHERKGQLRLSDYLGKVVYLHVVDGKHPTVFESVPYLKRLDDRDEPSLVFFLLYLPDLERVTDANNAIQWALEIAPGFPAGPRAFRPLGTMKTFPMNFVIDRRGRIRQRWAGFSEPLTEAALKAALAEN